MFSDKRFATSFRIERELCLLILFFGTLINAHSNDYDYWYGGHNDNEYGEDWVQGETCFRKCSDDESPKYCYWKLTVEHYTSMNAACDFNRWSGEITYETAINTTTSNGCVLLDGVERALLVSNRKFPLSFQVCRDDFVIVDVVNQITNEIITFHWHGIEQRNTQYFDGVPLVTQCPIIPHQTFRYMFRANLEGTYYWHSHVDTALSAPGALIVREPASSNPHHGMYDYDEPQHFIFLTDILAPIEIKNPPGNYRQFLGEMAHNIFINGHGKYKDPNTGNFTKTPYASYTMIHGKRYRMRLINAMATVCLTQLSITDHKLAIIALDGMAVAPKKVDVITTSTGERVDFIIKANCINAAQWIIIRGLGECEETEVFQLGIIHCQNGPDYPNYEINAYRQTLETQQRKVVFSPIETGCVNPEPNAVCTTGMESVRWNEDQHNIGADGTLPEPYATYVLVFDFREYEKKTFFTKNITAYYVAPDASLNSAVINGEMFEEGLPPRIITIKEDPYYKLKKHKLIIPMPKNKIIQIVNIDANCLPIVNHPIHKHGGFFKPLLVMGYSDFPASLQNTSWQQRGSYAMSILNEKRQTGTLNLNTPIRDTMVIPYCGVVVYQFNTSNPGPWFMHCHFAWHHITGMSVIFEVGDSDDIPPIPPNFPRCTDFKPGSNYLDFIEYLEDGEF